MKVVVIGGAGAFGGRLVDLLCRDGHDVWVAGRTKATLHAVAAAHGAAVLVVDRDRDLAALWAVAPDVVVDAAGPFHAYGDDPYVLARACIAQGVHYLDLADTPGFCAGIGVLDEAAQAAGVFALSGLSSVPAVSSAAVAALAEGHPIDTIDAAIVPGNRAPRGKSVIASILHQTGVPFDVTMDGVAVPVRGWSRPAGYLINRWIKRRAWMIAVPDQRLFPKAFGARTVMFRAGMELGMMNHGLAALSWLRGKLGFGITDWFLKVIGWGAALLKPFGSDVGGMSVRVVRKGPDGWQARTWRLLAQEGEGPFVPTIAARAVLRAPEGVAAGARPAVGVVTLADCEAAMDDLAIMTEVVEADVTPLFEAFLGHEFAALPPVVQAAHDVPGVRAWAGRARVTRGASRWARLIAALFRFPKAAEDIPVGVVMTPDDGTETWVRTFDGAAFQSVLKQTPQGMTERFGPMTFQLDLHVQDGALHFPVQRGWCLGVPIPRFLLPVSDAVEAEVDGRFHFDVALRAPLTKALIVRYQGWLERAASDSGEVDGAVRED